MLLLAVLLIGTARAELRPYLYEVRKGEAVSYLFGTMHFGVAMDEVRPFVESRMRASRKVYFEVVSDRERERLWFRDPITAFLGSPEFNAKGRPLDAGARTRLIKHYGFDPRIATALTDEACDMFVVALMLRQPSLDSELQLAALEQGLQVLPLEDSEVRARADEFAPPERCQVKDMLRRSRGYWSSLESEMVREYRVGRERRLTSRELQFRNAHWLRTLVPEMNEGGVFVAVGVDHLFEAREGLLRRLREAGFTINRIL